MAEDANISKDAQDEQGNDMAGKTPTVEELMAELAKEKAAAAKQKNALDKALKETGELKKSLRAHQTADEAAEADRKAHEQELQEKYEALLRENTLTKNASNFKTLGFTDEQALDAATALADGDTDSLFKVLGLGIATLTKTAQTTWLNNRPPVNSGVAGSAVLTKEQFDKMGIAEKSKLKWEHPEEYERLRSL